MLIYKIESFSSQWSVLFPYYLLKIMYDDPYVINKAIKVFTMNYHCTIFLGGSEVCDVKYKNITFIITGNMSFVI